VLGRLNEALVERDGAGSFCTVAYAVVEPRSGAARVRPRARRPPAPAARACRRGVEPLGQPGTMLGADRVVRVRDAEAIWRRAMRSSSTPTA
jgi:hypothetical protein